MLVRDGNRVFAAERRLAGEHLEQHDAGRVEVAARVDAFAARLLGREILRGAHDGAGLGDGCGRLGDRARDPEVHDLDLAVAGDHDVARLDVAVHDPGAVRVLERGQDLAGDPHGLVFGQRALGDDVFEQSAVDVLHDDERDLRLVAARVDDGLFAGIENAHDRRDAPSSRHPAPRGGSGCGMPDRWRAPASAA